MRRARVRPRVALQLDDPRTQLRIGVRSQSMKQALATLALVTVFVFAGTGCGGGKSTSKTTGTTATQHLTASPTAQGCVDRWNNNLERFAGSLGKVPNIDSYAVHVGTVQALCVVVVMRGPDTLVFTTHSRKPVTKGSDYLVVPTNGQKVRAVLRVPNGRFDKDLKLTLNG